MEKVSCFVQDSPISNIHHSNCYHTQIKTNVQNCMMEIESYLDPQTVLQEDIKSMMEYQNPIKIIEEEVEAAIKNIEV